MTENLIPLQDARCSACKTLISVDNQSETPGLCKSCKDEQEHDKHILGLDFTDSWLFQITFEGRIP